MKLVEHDEVIDNFATEGSDEPLDVTVLPRRARRDAELLAQREVLGNQVRARTKGADERADDCCEKLKHPASLLKASVFVSGDSCRETP